MSTTVMRLHAAHASDPRFTMGLSSIAAETFPLAAPADTPPEAISAHIAKHFTPEAFRRHLLDPAAHIWAVLVGVGVDDIAAASAADGRVSEDLEVKIVGYALVIEGQVPTDGLPGESSDTCLLSKFYLAPDLHGRGLAGEFMSRVLDDLVQLDLTSVWLTVNERNLRAIRFYLKHRFTQIGTQSFTVGEDHLEHDLVLYRKVGS